MAGHRTTSTITTNLSSFYRLFSNPTNNLLHKTNPRLNLKVPCRCQSRFSGGNWDPNNSFWGRIFGRRRSGFKFFLAMSGGGLGCGSLLYFLYSTKRGPNNNHLVAHCTSNDNRDPFSNLHTNRINEIPHEGKLSLDEAIILARDLIERKKIEWGCPGISIAVSIDGKNIWSEGFGYSDLENRVPCTRDTIMRIASISKPITMAAIAKMWEAEKINLDKPVQHYVPSFPEKEIDGEKVTITLRNLLSHMSGIRHYSKDYLNKKDEKNEKNKKLTNSTDNNNNNKNSSGNNNNDDHGDEDEDNSNPSAENSEENEEKDSKKEKEPKEFYLNRPFKNIDEALTLFKDDPLAHKPGSKYLYTTHGWTLASAVLEKASNIPFPKMMKAVFKELGLHNTCFDQNEPIIYNRARFYRSSKSGQIVNVPYVDNSYKWAGGGFLSNVGDLIKFGNAMLYSFQYTGPEDNATSNGHPQNPANSRSSTESPSDECHRGKPGYLKRSTMMDLWKPVEGARSSEASDICYGLGWFVLPEKYEHPFCLRNRFYTCHTGGAVGTSSILLILPSESIHPVENPPRGVVIAALANLSGLSFVKVAANLALIFERVKL